MESKKYLHLPLPLTGKSFKTTTVILERAIFDKIFLRISPSEEDKNKIKISKNLYWYVKQVLSNTNCNNRCIHMAFLIFFFPDSWVISVMLNRNILILGFFLISFPSDGIRKQPPPIMLPSFYVMQSFLDKTFLTKKSQICLECCLWNANISSL